MPNLARSGTSPAQFGQRHAAASGSPSGHSMQAHVISAKQPHSGHGHSKMRPSDAS